MNSSTAIPHVHTYQGNAHITFSVNNEGALSVDIDTARLHFRSVSEQDVNNYCTLFRDQDVMEHYSTGQIKTVEKIAEHLERWMQWWQRNNPYSSLAIFRKDTGEFIGHTLLEYGHMSGQGEISYIFLEKHWGQGFGTEVVTTILQEYAPATVKEGYLLGEEPLPDDASAEIKERYMLHKKPAPLDLIIAKSRFDNPQSSRILEKAGMRYYMKERKYGFWRQYHFTIIKNPNSN